jgi:hypothetical protein
MEIDGNTIADQLVKEGSSHLFIELEPALGISTKVNREVMKDWMRRKHMKHWQSTHAQRQAMGLKKNLLKKLENCSTSAQTQLRIITGLLTEHCNLKGYLFKVGLVNSPGCDKCKQASETASHVLCQCKALATFRFRPLCYHFIKSGDFEDIAVSTILHFFKVQGC